MRPIEPILVTPHNPGQTSNPIGFHIMSIPNPPRSFEPGAQHSIPMSSLPSSTEGKPSGMTYLTGTEIVSSQGQTYGIDKSTVYVPPTHTNVVNPPSSYGQPLGAQLVTNQTSWG